MSQPIHTPGPVEFEINEQLTVLSLQSADRKKIVSPEEYAGAAWLEVSQPDRRLLAAAYNAFDFAARKLGVNAVLLAEGLQHGAIADLISALEQAREHIDGEIDVVDGDYGIPAPNKAMRLAQEIDDALAKVKGGAS